MKKGESVGKRRGGGMRGQLASKGKITKRG